MTKERGSGATIYDIASRLGISASAVSKALNGRGRVSEETMRAILDTAKELNYAPNPAARYLKTKKTQQIMLSIPTVKDMFFFDMLDAVEAVARDNGYSLLLNNTGDDEREELRMLECLGQNFVDGLILVSINITENHLREIRRIGKPVVLSCVSENGLTREKNVCDYIGAASKKGLRLAARHLIDQGHRAVGYVGHGLNTCTGMQRHAGFCGAMEEAGLPVEDAYVITGGFTEAFGYEAGQRFAAMGSPPTAVCAATDLIVMGMYRAFEQLGVRIPQDVALVGMDDISIDTLVRPRISSVALSQDKIGKMAAELIFQRLSGMDEPWKEILFEPTLIVRESSVRAAEQ